LKNETAATSVRVAAVSLLPEDKLDKVAVAELMVKALQDGMSDDDRRYRRTAETAVNFLKLYGTADDFSSLKKNKPRAQWKRELVEEMIGTR